MRSGSLLLLSCLPVLTLGCNNDGGQASVISLNLPEADLTPGTLEFGEVDWGSTATKSVVLTNPGDVDMGIYSIALMEDGMIEDFSIAWNPNAITCPESDDEASAEAKDLGVDTGSQPADTGGSGGGGGGGVDTGSAPSGDVVILGAGCSLQINTTYSPTTVGEAYAAFQVISVTEDVEKDPTYYRDPDQFKKVVLIHGSTSRGDGNIVVKSPTVDMGHHYTGETSIEQIYVFNVGEGDLTLTEPILAEDCDTAFTLDLTEYQIDRPLGPGESTLFEAVFTPDDLDPALCQLTVYSDDYDTPEQEVSLRGNYGDDPENAVPTAAIRAPVVGYQHNSADPLVVEVDIFDQNQPATTLYCKIKSYLAEGSIADCTPTDDSGHTFVEIPIDDLEVGTDTLRVQVTDQAENRTYASTTILWMSDYPDGDDDGDGWGDSADLDETEFDCDDTDKNVYPYAAEIYDGKDNDCDGGIDEGTEGADDDGDGVTEIEGDCDDTDSNTYPGAPEQADLKDNDCDGVIDEGTSFADDDGDGFSEVDNDCDDDDETINPAAIELCDGIDNNCNGLKDHQEGCVEIDSEPVIIGGVRMSHTAIGVGESSTMTVFVYDADGQNITYNWSEDADLTSEGHTAIDSPTSQTITWTAPSELPSGSQGEVYSVYVIAMDEDGNQAWAFDEIWVYPDAVATSFDKTIADPKKGCGDNGTDTAAAIPALGLFSLFALARRRREDDE